MTEAERAYYERYVAGLRDTLRLSHWTIVLDQATCSDNSYAEMLPCSGRYIAHLRVCPEWTTLSAVDQRLHTVHELLHVHFEAASDVVREDLKEHLGSAFQPVKASFSRLMEYSVDAVADAIAPLLPLPEWPVAKVPA